ncbi:hypothetical protein BDW74DRAFT_165177 [Aspergillus multicolor]|uniref:uncharacterized protein n=1 Tax=Aspergillus multicolor TaxID=41759 RepID=UPI003CCDEA14
MDHNDADGSPVDIWVAPDEYKGVARAASDLALDFGRVMGLNGIVHQNTTFSNIQRSGVPVIVGTVGTTLIDRLVGAGKLDVSEIKGQWESYVQAVVNDPINGTSQALDISKTIGVSPWYWWADVTVKTKDVIYLNSGHDRIQGSPSVKYRGVFINDEWQLIDWAERRFPQTSTGSHFTSDFCVLLFELLLRLKANYLWPAMKQYNSFYLEDSKNGELADEYGIIMGTSHHEPMTRSYYEQQRRLDGMRGDGDRESPTLNSTQLEEIIQVQQAIIEDTVSTPPGGEVGKYWQAGMNVSELVTLLWADDNFGNLLQVPLPNEQHLVKAWEQLYIAYERKARNIWIANIQDLKGFVRGTHELLLDMAYDMSAFETPDGTTKWLKRWATREFGPGVADAVTEIYNVYGLLTSRRKYETLSMSPFAFSTLNYDEAANILQEWEDLLALAQETYDTLEPLIQRSFFELVLHPVLAGKTVMEHNKLAKRSLEAFATDAAITKRYHSLFNGKWNGAMSNPHIGYTNRNFPPQNIMPNTSWIGDEDSKDVDILGITGQGLNTAQSDKPIILRSVDLYMPLVETRYIDIFTRSNGTFSYKIESNVSYASVTNSAGTLTSGGNSDVRAVITFDWDRAPSGLTWVALNVSRTTNSTGNNTISTITAATATLPVNKTSIPYSLASPGHIESNGVIAIELIHYTQSESRQGVSYIDLPYYGRTLSALKLWPDTAPSQYPSTEPKLTNNIYTFSRAPKATLILLLGGILDFDPTRPLKVAYSIDENEVQTKHVFPDYDAGTEPPDWDTAVDVGVGAQTLNLWLLEPGVVLQRHLIDLGGLKGSALGPPESRFID